MKKLFLLSIAVAGSIASFAQSSIPTVRAAVSERNLHPTASVVGHKTTAVIHDTLLMSHLSSTDTNDVPTNYFISATGSSFDSGFLGGTNFLGMDGFAERYEFKTTDSSVQILGVYAAFDGTVQSTSTKTAVFTAWSQAAPTVVRPTLRYNGFPGTVLGSVSAPYTSIPLYDTAYHLKAYYFATPTSYLNDTFFVGYTTTYTFSSLGGDTIGVLTTKMNGRNSPVLFTSSSPADTTVNVQNASRISGNWRENAANLGFAINYYMFPIVNTKVFLGVNGVTHKNFTFYGNYPNPAVDYTNIKFAVAKATDVTITVVDVAGRIVNTISKNGLAAGEHMVNVETANLSAGNYICIIRTKEGEGIASQIVVTK